MTVKELIEELKKFDENLPVGGADWCGNFDDSVDVCLTKPIGNVNEPKSWVMILTKCGCGPE